MIVEMNNQASEMTRELRRRDERIFDLENQIFFLKAQTPIKPYSLSFGNKPKNPIIEFNYVKKTETQKILKKLISAEKSITM